MRTEDKAKPRRCRLLVPHIAHVEADRQFSYDCPGIGLHDLPQPAPSPLAAPVEGS